MKAILAEATDRLNKEQLGWLTSTIVAKLPNNGKVGILGLSYKPNTNVVEKSQGLLLARALIAKGISVILYDPVANREAVHEIKNKSKTTFALSIKECIRLSDVIVIAVPWNEFRKITPAHFKNRKPKQVLIDCWRILEKERFDGCIDYVALGVAPDNQIRKL
jgi:UDPglucose 6-dehydrogenase